MGTRVNYEVLGEDGTQPAVIFFSNSHHDSEDPQKVFAKLVKKMAGVRALVAAVLAVNYQTSNRGHRAGDPMFSIDLYPGDREFVVKAVYRENGAPLISTEVAKAPVTSMEDALEKLLRQTKADQGGECTFEEWLQATADDPTEFLHEEALVLRQYRTRGIYVDEGVGEEVSA